MPKCLLGPVAIHYETAGDPSGVPFVLVAGVGAQLLSFSEPFVDALIARGAYVVRIDNRDIGLSEKLDGEVAPDLFEAVQKGVSGEAFETPYRLSDMAGDVFHVLDALKLERVHFVGQSMGGMIVQWCALLHPERVRSLTSIMSTTGRNDVSFPTPEALQLLLEPAAPDREAFAEQAVRTAHVFRGGVLAIDEDAVRADARRAFDRDSSTEGFARQFAAIMRDGESRREKLARLAVPTLVVHGTHDPLVPFGAGEDTAAVIPDATLFTVKNMGHHVSGPFVDEVVGALWAHATQHNGAAAM